jgi:hypothetical protein
MQSIFVLWIFLFGFSIEQNLAGLLVIKVNGGTNTCNLTDSYTKYIIIPTGACEVSSNLLYGAYLSQDRLIVYPGQVTSTNDCSTTDPYMNISILGNAGFFAGSESVCSSYSSAGQTFVVTFFSQATMQNRTDIVDRIFQSIPEHQNIPVVVIMFQKPTTCNVTIDSLAFIIVPIANGTESSFCYEAFASDTTKFGLHPISYLLSSSIFTQTSDGTTAGFGYSTTSSLAEKNKFIAIYLFLFLINLILN